MDYLLNDYHRNITDEELIDDILNVAKKLGKNSVTKNQYKSSGGKYNPNTIEKRFGGWLNAIIKCGLTPTEKQINSSSGTYTKSYITTEELIEDLQRVSELINKQTFSSQEYNKYGIYSYATFINRFKSWNKALDVSGLKPFEVVSGKRISENNLLEEIEKLWIELGRQPTTTDIKNGISKYSLHAYVRRFGSWRKALKAFISYINGEYELDYKSEKSENKVDFEYMPTKKECKPIHKTKRDINLRLRFKVMQRDNFKCCICGASPAKDPSVELHIDHIVPWSKGGETTFENLQTLCSKCNLGKSDLI